MKKNMLNKRTAAVFSVLLGFFKGSAKSDFGGV